MILLSFGIASCSYNNHRVAEFEKIPIEEETRVATYLNDAGTVQHQVQAEKWQFNTSNQINALSLITIDNEKKFTRVIQDQRDDKEFYEFHDEYITNGADAYNFYSPHLIQILDKTNGTTVDTLEIKPMDECISADNKAIAEYISDFQNGEEKDEGKEKFTRILDSLATVTANEARSIVSVALDPKYNIEFQHDLTERTVIGHKEFPTGSIASIDIKLYDRDDNDQNRMEDDVIVPGKDEANITVKYRGKDGNICRTECLAYTQDGRIVVRTPNAEFDDSKFTSSFSKNVFNNMNIPALSNIYRQVSNKNVGNVKDLVDLTK